MSALDRTHGGPLLLHPYLRSERAGWHRGTADAVWRNAELIREFAPDALVVASADAIYKLDYADLLDEHVETGAAVTMVTARVAAEDAARYGVVRADGQGKSPSTSTSRTGRSVTSSATRCSSSRRR